MALAEGDFIRLESLNDDEKDEYPHGWNLAMDQYIGKITKIISIIPCMDGSFDEEDEYYLECDNGRFMWSSIHLTKVEPQKVQIF